MSSRMNKNKRNFWLDAILGVLFVLTAISLLGGQGRNADKSAGAQLLDLVHYISGALLILGSLLHIIWHWDWMKIVAIKGSGTSAKGVRANRTTDLVLLVLFGVCGVTGPLVCLGMMLPDLFAPTLRALSALHRLTGTAMLIVVMVHLALHWKWITHNVRRYLGIGSGSRVAVAPTTTSMCNKERGGG